MSKPIGYVVVRWEHGKPVLWVNSEPWPYDNAKALCDRRNERLFDTVFTYTFEPVGAAPTDAGLREALEQIATGQGWKHDDFSPGRDICSGCGEERQDGHAPHCPFLIARAALSHGGGE